MLLRATALLSVLRVAAAAAATSGKSAPVPLPKADIPAGSKLGSRLLAASRQLDNDDQEATWIAGYSLKFEKCATSEEYYGGYFGGEGGDNNNNNGNNGGYNGMYQQRLVHYKLCPTGSCGKCSDGADYVIDMNMFVEAFIESKLEAQEQQCQAVMENCYYDDEYQCYAQAGLDFCGDNDQNNNNNNGQNGQAFELQEAARCGELDVDDEALQYYYYQQQGNGNGQNYNYNNNNNNGGGDGGEMALFVGPYCSADGKNIYLGTFMDEMCSYPAPDGTYEKLNYGNALPYAKETLIDANCLACRAPGENDNQNQNNNNNNNNNNNGNGNGDDYVNNYYNYQNNQDDDVEILEMCERLYEDAGKCETNLASGVTYYPNTYACEFIQTLQKPGKMAGTSSGGVPASKVLAGLFAATTMAFAGVAYVLHSKARRSRVDLAGEGGGTLA